MPATRGENGCLSKCSLAPLIVSGKNFYSQRERATCSNSTVSSDSHFEIGHWWFEPRHLDCFRWSQSSVPCVVCFRFFEASYQKCGSLCHDYNLVITCSLGSFDHFPFYLHVLSSPIALILWLKFFHRQKTDREKKKRKKETDRGHGSWGQGP